MLDRDPRPGDEVKVLRGNGTKLGGRVVNVKSVEVRYDVHTKYHGNFFITFEEKWANNEWQDGSLGWYFGREHLEFTEWDKFKKLLEKHDE